MQSSHLHSLHEITVRSSALVLFVLTGFTGGGAALTPHISSVSSYCKVRINIAAWSMKKNVIIKCHIYTLKSKSSCIIKRAIIPSFTPIKSLKGHTGVWFWCFKLYKRVLKSQFRGMYPHYRWAWQWGSMCAPSGHSHRGLTFSSANGFRPCIKKHILNGL